MKDIIPNTKYVTEMRRAEYKLIQLLKAYSTALPHDYESKLKTLEEVRHEIETLKRCQIYFRNIAGSGRPSP
jgi:hypothetical protein